MKKRLLVLAFVLLAAAACVILAQSAEVQERYTYQRVVAQPSGRVRYTETYEQRAKDLEDNTFHTVTKTITEIDKAQKLAELTAQRQLLVDQAQALQQRINALNALP